MFFPILIIVVGLIWLLNSLGIISTDLWSIVLPVAVVLAGISMLTKKCCCCHKKTDHGSESEPKNN